MITLSTLRSVLGMAAIAAFTASTSFAGTPNLLGYQGRLTDGAGAPLPDGPKNLRFIIWDHPTSSLPANEIWNSGPTTVTTTEGLFSIQLGASPQPALDANLFSTTELYLGISVGADPEISPRTRLSAVPYSFATNDAPYVDVTGDVMTGALALPQIDLGDVSTSGALFMRRSGTGSFSAIHQDFSGLGGRAEWYDENAVTHSVIGSDFNGEGGFFAVYGNTSFSNGFTVDGNAGGTNSPSVYIQGSGSLASFHSSQSGSPSVQLPADAVQAFEVLDEPGIASNFTTAGVLLTKTEASSTNILSVTITVPASGYVVVDGSSCMYFQGTGSCFGWLQITETSGAAAFAPTFVWVNNTGYANTSSAYTYQTTPVRKIKSVPGAGSYTFYLQGNAYSFNDASASVGTTYAQWLTAVYYPTSYGSVVAPMPENADHPEMIMEKTFANPDGTGERTTYKADLRYYELKAAEASRMAAEAQLALERARSEMKAQAEAGKSTAVTKP